MASYKAFMKSGHQPTLLAAFLYFNFSFAIWVLNGAMGPFISQNFHLSPAQIGFMVSVPTLAGAFMRFPLGVLSQYIGRKNAAIVEMSAITTLSVVFLIAIAALFGLMATPTLTITTLLFMLCSAALGAGNGATFQLVPLRWPLATAVAGGMIGEIGALGGGILPNVLGMSKQHTGSYRLGWICYAALAFVVLIVMRLVARSWTTTWVGSGGRSHPDPLPEAVYTDDADGYLAADCSWDSSRAGRRPSRIGRLPVVLFRIDNGAGTPKIQRCYTKLRIKGNSLRLRVTRSEVSKVIAAGRIEETIHFSSNEQSSLTYALACEAGLMSPQIRYKPSEVMVLLPEGMAVTWAESDQVGIYTTIDLGPHGTLDLSVEKDFACLDLSYAENIDTFPNPKA
jgi:hypothetical protein